jgi:hypothetical protein
MRKCPFHGCEEVVLEVLFACPRHWRSLTKAEQAEVWEAYQAYRRDEIGVEGLRKRQQAVLSDRGSAVDPKVAEALRKLDESR